MRTLILYGIMFMLQSASFAAGDEAKSVLRFVPQDCALLIRVTSGIDQSHPVRNFFRGKYIAPTPLGMVRHEIFESKSQHTKIHTRRVKLNTSFEGLPGVIETQTMTEDQGRFIFTSAHSTFVQEAAMNYIWNEGERTWGYVKINPIPEPENFLSWEMDVVMDGNISHTQMATWYYLGDFTSPGTGKTYQHVYVMRRDLKSSDEVTPLTLEYYAPRLGKIYSVVVDRDRWGLYSEINPGSIRRHSWLVAQDYDWPALQ